MVHPTADRTKLSDVLGGRGAKTMRDELIVAALETEASMQWRCCEVHPATRRGSGDVLWPVRAESRSLQWAGYLDHSDVLGFLALSAWCDVEFDNLTLVEGLVSITGDVRVVDKHIVTRLTRDEAEALFAVEEFYCALHSACFRFA